MQNNGTYKGFDLFNDIEDIELRTRNRAVVLANMASDHSKNQRINGKGAALILGYFNEIVEGERNAVKEGFLATMQQRGFRLVA